MRRVIFVLVLTMVCPGFACGDDDGTIDELYEGDEAGECSDGADNDQDGLFDCDDDGCAGSPDCLVDHEGDEVGECSDGTDNDQDGLFDCDDDDCAGSPDCDCAGACPAYGDLDCSGDMLQECLWGPDGCLQWYDLEDCALTNAQCLHGECTTGACAITGDLCTTDGDCGGAAVEITGSCITFDAGGGYWVCGYDTRFDTGATELCDGTTYGRCSTSDDCMSGAYCDALGDEWCEEATQGVCTRYDASGGPCVSDAECTYQEDDFCVVCGDGVVQGPYEECDDGNRADDDGCSSQCKYEGICYGTSGPGIGRCANNDDCPMMSCGMATECYCVFGYFD